MAWLIQILEPVSLNKTGDILAVGASFANGRQIEGKRGRFVFISGMAPHGPKWGVPFRPLSLEPVSAKRSFWMTAGTGWFAQNGIVVCPSTPCAYYYAQSTAYIYDWDGDNWTQKGDPLSATSASSYGVDIDISGDGSTVAIGGGLDSNADDLKTEV